MVSFSSENEKKVYEGLIKIDPKIGQMYYSGLVVLRQTTPPQTQVSDSPFSENMSEKKDLQTNSSKSSENVMEENPCRIAQSAYSMRETLKAMLEHPKIITLISELTRKDKIQKFFDPQHRLPDFLQITSEKLLDLYGWFNSVLHLGRTPSEQEYLTKVEKFTALMCFILTPHYEVIEEIDELLKKSSPDKKDLEKLESLMSRNTQSYNYFFKKADGSWLQTLVDDGKYFQKVPSVIKKENSYSFPFWPESYYLERIASEKPELVEKIISQITTPKEPLERNSTVLKNFVSAALNMPPEIGKLVAKKAIKEKWHDGMSVSILDRLLADLMLRLVDSEFETALDLCDFLLYVTLGDNGIPDLLGISRKYIRPVIDSYSYEQILKEDIPVLCEKDRDVVLDILVRKLSKANSLASKSYQKPEKDPKQDISYVWRPAIEDHEQNYGFDLRSHLVTAIREILEKSESTGIDSLKKSLMILSNQDYYIFRRLEMYFFGRHSSDFPEEVNTLSIECFGEVNFKHEYYHMLKNSYPSLKPETQKKILDIISKGPDFDNYRGTKEEFATYKKYWRIEKLSPIIEHLPDLQKEYDSLVSKYGKSNLIEFNSYHESSYQVTHPSDLSEDMSVSQVLEFIKSYEIPKDIFFLEEDGSGNKFKELVEKNPQEYSQHATELLSCHGLFHFWFLDGLSKVKDKKLDWDSILNFCESVIVTSPSKDSKVLDLILDCFGDLLQNNLIHNKTAIPFDLRDRVWKILQKAIEIAPPDTTCSENYPDKNFNAHTISINSSIGRLWHALIQYALWCYIKRKNKGVVPTEFVPEVKSFLESKLSPEQEQSISTHAVLGLNFSNLLAIDDKWAKSKIDSIFTHDEPHAKAGDAAWDAYTSNQIYQDSFNILFDEYKYRISHPSCRTESSLHDVPKRLAQQIGLGYLNSINQSKELFEYFLEKSDIKLIDECLEWIGRSLKEWEGKDPPKMDVSELLSYEKIKSNPSAGWLFLNPLMPKTERIKLLDSILDETQGKIYPIYLIPEEMEKFAEEFPLETITCIEKIIQHYESSNEMYLMTRYIENIFSKINTTGNSDAIDKMKDVINFLGSLGYDDFRKFLN